MSENVFMPVTAIPKSMETISLIDQMDKQYITVGEYLSNQIADRYRTEHDGKELKHRNFMEAQRSYTWEKWRASNFVIAVMLHRPIDEIWLYRKDDKDQFKKCVDGQQRLTTLWLITKDCFPLDMSHCGFVKFPFEDKIYSVKESLHGKKFSELSEDWQNAILHYSFDLKIFNNCSDEQAEMIYTEKANGTKPLKPIEVRKAGMGIEIRNFIYSLIDQHWILHMMTKSSAFGARGLDTLSQLITLAYHNGAIELSKDNIDEAIYGYRDFGMDEKVKNDLFSTGQYISRIFDFWIEQKKKNQESQIKGRKVKNLAIYKFPMLTKKTIAVMFLWATYQAYLMKIDESVFQEWAFKFFNEPNAKFKLGLADGRTKAGDYNNVKLRIEAINEELDKLKKSPTVNNVSTQDKISEET